MRSAPSTWPPISSDEAVAGFRIRGLKRAAGWASSADRPSNPLLGWHGPRTSSLGTGRPAGTTHKAAAQGMTSGRPQTWGGKNMRGNGNQEGAMLAHEQPNRWPTCGALATRALPAGGLPTCHSPNQKQKKTVRSNLSSSGRGPENPGGET